jgi:hypothetical protein
MQQQWDLLSHSLTLPIHLGDIRASYQFVTCISNLDELDSDGRQMRNQTDGFNPIDHAST